VFDMFRTTKCSSSVRLVHVYAVLWYQTHPDIDQTAYMDARKKKHKTACKNLPEDEHLDVRNMSKTI
jgi:hypothetical protein